MATVYKKFSPQDFHIIPFNAHKQYSFNSGSASTNSIKVFSTRYTSESISLYSSASTNPDGLVDNINNVKYNQIDHLFYRDFLVGRVIQGEGPGSGFQDARGIDFNKSSINYDFLNHKRELHNHANVISVPAGTYGHSIKKGTFFISSSNYITPHSSSTTIVDDSKGMLIISGTNLNNYVTDCRQNILNIGPVKGFKRYDLNTIGDIHPYDKNGYFIHNFIEESTGIDGLHNTGYIKYLKGSKRIKPIERYTSLRNVPTNNVDDSYYLNPIHYININFSEKDLFIIKKTTNNSSSLANFDRNFIIEADRFPTIDFMGKSEIKIDHNTKFNFNKDEDFTINFWMRSQKIGTLSIGNYTIKPDKKQYLISKSTTKTTVPTPLEGAAQTLNINTTGSSQLVDVDSGDKFPFEIYIDQPSSDEFVYFARSDGEITSTVSASITSFSQSAEMHHITCRYSASQMEIFIDGIGSGISGSDLTSKPTQNEANLYIGNKGGLFYNHTTRKYQIPNESNPNRNIHNFNGSLSQVNIFNTALTDTQVKNHYSSSNGSPYVGNIFYSHGIATITHPSHQRILYNTTYNKDLDIENRFSFDLNMLGFQGQIDSSEMDTAGTDASDITTLGGADVFIKPDGTKAYIDGGTGRISQFTLSTPYDISSATFEKNSPEYKMVEPTYTATVDRTHGITFNNDGSKVYIANAKHRVITEISLTSSFDVGTFHTSKSINIASASYISGDNVSAAQFGEVDLNFSMSRHPNNAFKLQALSDIPGSPRFNTSGDKLYFIHQKRAVLYEMQLSESFDIGSHKCFITGSGNTTFGLSGSSEADNRRETHILMKDLSKLASGSFKAGGTNITATTNDVPGGFTFSPDGKHLLAANTENDTINHFFLSSSFDINTIYPNLNNRRKFLPLKSETIETGIITAEGVQGLHWVEVTGSKITPSGSDSRLYVSIRDRDNRTGDNAYEYHISKSAIHNIKYQGTHLIYEHEYQCSVDEHEYNNTYNISARKIPTNKEETIANFATGSLFKPFVTTVGLYNENRELLVVGKLGSPIRMSDETDTTFVLRWDV